jgi:hypothetical protein
MSPSSGASNRPPDFARGQTSKPLSANATSGKLDFARGQTPKPLSANATSGKPDFPGGQSSRPARAELRRAGLRRAQSSRCARQAAVMVYGSVGVKFLCLLVALTLSGCQWSQSALEGSADVEIDIPCSDITKILSVTKQLMQANGYQATRDLANQEVPFVAAHQVRPINRVLCFSNSGRDRIWVIAQPSGQAWTLYCLPEPERYDTSFARRKFRQILLSVRAKCS